MLINRKRLGMYLENATSMNLLTDIELDAMERWGLSTLRAVFTFKYLVICDTTSNERD